MNKNHWYYENSCTGEICDDKWQADFWASDGATINYWHWSEYEQEWVMMMTREG